MRRALGLIAIAFLAGSSVYAQTESGESDSQCAGERRPAGAQIADLAKSSNFRTLVYSEHSDGRAGGRSEIGIGIIAQPPGTTGLTMYRGEQTAEIMQAIACEEGVGETDRWSIAIVVDNGDLTVERGPSPGAIDGFNARLRAAADRAFPGHTAYPHAAPPAE